MSRQAMTAMLGVGMATVRTHLKRLIIKTDTHRQAELVGLAASLSTAN